MKRSKKQFSSDPVNTLLINGNFFMSFIHHIQRMFSQGPALLLANLLVILFIVSLASCGDSSSSTGTTQADQTRLLSGSSLGTSSTSDINATISGLSSFGLSNISAAYNVDMYRLTYTTLDNDGETIIVSGLLAVPQKGGATSPLLGLQHGTIFLDDAAPTNNAAANHIAVISASLGYVVAAADYIGYGESSATLHPYIHAKTLAQTTIDMLRAARTYASTNSILLNDQLFLAGYSEGGYATLAAQKEIEQELSGEFTITASLPGAGPYNMTSLASTIVGNATIPVPAYVGFLMKSYDTYYSLGKLGDYFAAPYNDGRLDTLYDGTNSFSVINAALTSVTADLFNTGFLTRYSDAGETGLKAAFADNDIYNWTPTSPTVLFHGPDDMTVPYSMMVDATTAMAGSSSVLSQDCVLSAALTTHSNCYYPYFSYVLGTYLNNVAQNL